MKIAILELLACTSLIAAFVPSAIRAPQHRQISSKLEMVGSVTLYVSLILHVLVLFNSMVDL